MNYFATLENNHFCQQAALRMFDLGGFHAFNG
jgi:hypothetical protein